MKGRTVVKVLPFCDYPLDATYGLIFCALISRSQRSIA